MLAEPFLDEGHVGHLVDHLVEDLLLELARVVLHHSLFELAQLFKPEHGSRLLIQRVLLENLIYASYFLSHLISQKLNMIVDLLIFILLFVILKFLIIHHSQSKLVSLAKNFARFQLKIRVHLLLVSLLESL